MGKVEYDGNNLFKSFIGVLNIYIDVVWNKNIKITLLIMVSLKVLENPSSLKLF